MRHRNAGSLAPWLLATALLSSCGSGTWAIFGSGGGGGGSSDVPPVVGDVLVGSDATDAKTSPVTFTFRITDADSDLIDVDVLYTPPGGGTPAPAQLVGITNLDDLATGPGGTVHTREWDFAAQLPLGGAFARDALLTVRTRDLASSADSALFNVGNDAPTVANVLGPTGETNGLVSVSLSVADSSSDLVSIAVEYDDLGDAAGWLPATSSTGPLVDISTDPGGVPQYFVWDAPADVPHTQLQAKLRFTPDDGTAAGVPVETAVLSIDNNAEPVALVNGSAFFATPDQRRGIPLPLRIIDPEGDPIQIVVQWRTPLGSFPALPSDPASLDAIFASRTLRLQHQIATEAPISFGGRIVPVSPSIARLPELASTEAGIQVGVLPGRTLQILRTTSIPAAAASGWSSNPLTAPAALLPLDDGDTALVLDAPALGAWRLREIHLATGVVVRDLAAGSGDPDTLAWEEPDETVLVASDTAGLWQVDRVRLSDGSTTTLMTAGGSTVLGRVRGLASRGADKAVVTIGNSLVAIDATSGGAPPTETAIASDFQGACGIVLDPHNLDRLYVAERDWVNPATSTVEGRVVAVDLVSNDRTTVAATSFPFLRPDAVAVDTRSNRLLVLTDRDVADGTREIRAVDLNGGGGGQAFQIASGYPNGCQGLATGPDGLRLLALTAANDLAVAGGVEQTRTIDAYDPTTSEVGVQPDFAPPIHARELWRIVDRIEPRPASASGIDEVFVWDSADLAAGGEVVLQATPYDGELGLPTDSGVPRPVRPGLDVTPYSIGSVATTSAPASVEAADLNGDGRIDLLTSNVGTDNLSLFFQPATGIYPSAPSATLTGVVILAPMTDPVSAQAINVDGDADLDVVSANRGSNNVLVFTQGGAGSFTASIPALGGVSGPSDVAGADLNADGRVDLVVASTASDRLAVYLHQTLGLYPTSPSFSIGNATSDAPVAIALGDLDGDGDVDIVSANRDSDNLTLFLQSAPGVFPSAPSATLGGAGMTDGPLSVAVGDVDRDGRLDIACADGAGNDLAVFLQDPSGGFNGTPTANLAASGSPLAPTHLEMADVNDDGAIDLVSCNGGNDISVFVYRPGMSQFTSRPLVLGSGSLSAPSSVAAKDFNGDGLLDLAAANVATNNVAVFQQRGAGGYTSATPDLFLGNAVATSDPRGLAAGDLDGDGDLDLVSANNGSGDLTVFEQISPSIFGSEPAYTLGSAAETAGARAVAAADLDGDELLDLVSANTTGNSLAVFFQQPLAGFGASADVVLNGLGAPAWVSAADLDADGDADLAAANSTGNDLRVYFQSAPGDFATAAPLTLGSAATTQGPSHLLALDLEGDGDIDLVSANTTGNNLALFLNPGSGAFSPTPSASIGSAGTTPSPRYLAAGDLDLDGDLDLACASGGNNSLAVFLQGTPGSFPAVPSFTRTHASLVTPDTIGAADIDLDGDLDLVSGNSGSRNLTIFRQGLPGVFATTPETLGGPAFTDSPRTLVVVDLDGDGDLDLVSAQPALDNLSIFFGSH